MVLPSSTILESIILWLSSPRAASGARNCSWTRHGHWVPAKHLRLLDEKHAQAIWERCLVLVRPGGHAAWRGDEVADADGAMHILASITVRNVTLVTQDKSEEVVLATNESSVWNEAFTFTSTVGLSTQTAKFELERRGGFQN